jgi:hypothetical protein
VLRGHADAVIRDIQNSVALLLRYLEFDAAAIGCVFDRVVEQVDDNLFESRLVAFDHHALGGIADDGDVFEFQLRILRQDLPRAARLRAAGAGNELADLPANADGFAEVYPRLRRTIYAIVFAQDHSRTSDIAFRPLVPVADALGSSCRRPACS